MKKPKDKSKQRKFLGTIIQVVIGGIIGGFIGFGAITGFDGITVPDPPGLALALIFIYLGAVIHIILHEAGHLIGGLLSGYQFVSFRVYSFIFIKENGRIVTKRYNLAGTAGQCLMSPPNAENYNFPYLLYNLGGGMLNFIFSGIFFALYMMLRDIFALSGVIFIPLIGIGILFGALNLVPLKLSGIANDGYNIFTMGKNKDARRAFYIMLQANASLLAGARSKDLPAEWLELPENYNDPLSATFALNRVGYFMDKHDFDAAKELATEILETADKVLEIHKNELRCNLLFIEIIGERRQEEIDRLYTKELQKYIKANPYHLSKRRLEYAYAKLVICDEAKTSRALNVLNKTFLTYPYKGELELERELVDIIDNRATAS